MYFLVGLLGFLGLGAIGFVSEYFNIWGLIPGH